MDVLRNVNELSNKSVKVVVKLGQYFFMTSTIYIFLFLEQELVLEILCTKP